MITQTKPTVTPYHHYTLSKKEQITLMFDNISENYDFLNHFLSHGIDKFWRRRVVAILEKYSPGKVLDIATGTGDLAIEIARLQPKKIIGVDISAGMLQQGRRKLKKRNLHNRIELKKGDSENLQFPDNSFDTVTVAFGVRNFENRKLGLREINRVLSPGGRVVFLEFSQPEGFPVRQLYNFYFTNILPQWGRLFSKDNFAYRYLPDSVKSFPYGEAFLDELRSCGFVKVCYTPLTFGIATIYEAQKN